MQNREHFLDPSTLAKIDDYYLVARTVVEGFIAGLHKSLYHGFGSEFVHYRNYTTGDDLKYVDWKVFARLDKVQIKVFQEETNSNNYIVLDTSASMNYKGKNSQISKIDYGKILTGCLAYLVNRQGDNVGFYAYNDALICALKPENRGSQVQNICTQMLGLEPKGICNHTLLLTHLAEMFRRKGIIVIISDFLDSDEILDKALRFFKVAHHDCILFHILDDDEVDFPFYGHARFIDSESGHEISTAPDVVRDQYLRSFKSYLEGFESSCLSHNLDYFRITTSQPLANALASYLHKRELFR